MTDDPDLTDAIRKHLYLHHKTPWSLASAPEEWMYERAKTFDFDEVSEHYQACHHAAVRAVEAIDAVMKDEKVKNQKWFEKQMTDLAQSGRRKL